MTYVHPDTDFTFGIRGHFVPDPTVIASEAWADVPLAHALTWRFRARAEMLGALGGSEPRWELDEAGGDWNAAGSEQLVGWLKGGAQRWVGGDQATFNPDRTPAREGWSWRSLPLPTAEALDVIETTLRSVGELDMTEVDARVPVARVDELETTIEQVGAGAGWLDSARRGSANHDVRIAITLVRGSGRPAQIETLTRALSDLLKPAGNHLHRIELRSRSDRPAGPRVDPLPYVPSADASIHVQVTVPQWDVVTAGWLIDATRLAAHEANLAGSIGIGVRAAP